MTAKISLSLIALALIFALQLNAHAASLNGYLSTYISNSTLSSATFYNQTLNGASYIIVQTGQINFTVVSNMSGTYALITNATTIQGVLTPFLTSKYYPTPIQLSLLNSSMQSYKRYGYANISDCLVETGLSQNTCTLANICQACQSSPVCKRVFDQVGGPSSPFGLGIINFSVQITNVNSNYSQYFALLKAISPSNAGTTLSELSSLTNNISAISSTLNQNPLFPPPTSASFSQCNSGLNPTQQPWFCVAVGFCSSIPQNASALNTVRFTLANLEASLPTTAGIGSISHNSSTTTQGYINSYLSTKNGAALTALISTYTPKVDSLLNSSEALLARYDNSTLNSSVLLLQNEFKSVETAGVNQSIVLAGNALNRIFANTTTTYAATTNAYDQVYGIAQNNSAAILADQLSYRQVPSQLAVLANQQQEINTKINSRITSNDFTTLLPQLQEIRVESALFIAPLTAGYMIKTLDSPFISAMLGPYNTPIPQKIAGAPFYAMVESLIIGILIILVVVVITYFRVMRKGKLKGNKKAQTRWMAVFIVLIILVILYAYSTYTYANSATAFLPFNNFLNTVKANGNVYIALNGSAASNSSIGSCVTTIQNYLTKASKTVQVIRLTNYSCVSGSNISVLGLNCYNDILGSGKPVIFISQAQENNITYRGLYGTVLYASGNVTAGTYCALGTLFKNV